MKFPKIKNRLSALTLAIAIAVSGYLYSKYSYFYVMSWDAYGYYLYLPQAFINNDLAMKNDSVVTAVKEKYPISDTFYQRAWSPDNKWVINYPMGMAYLYFPAFATGHIIAKITGAPVDGFSLPYENAMFLWCFLSVVAGLFFVRIILLRFFDDKVTALVLFLIAVGTNYLITVTLTVAMPHNFMFTLFAISLWLTIKWWETFKIKYAVLLGLCYGIAITSRFTEGIFIIIPALWGVQLSIKSVWERIVLLLTKRIIHVLIFGTVSFLVFLPQILYWKNVTGSYIFNAYEFMNPGEGLDLATPYTYSFLFSYKKGWLIYTPVMIFAILGFIQLYRKKRELFLPLFLFFVVNLWVISSWTTWWYAESFSQRPMVNSYPLMAVLLAFFIDGVIKSKKWIKFPVLALVVLVFFFNVFQHWQYGKGIIQGSRMTKEYYWKVFLKTKVDKADTILLSIDRPFNGITKFTNEGDYDKKMLCNYSFDSYDEFWDVTHYDSSRCISPGMSYRMDSSYNFSPDFRLRSSVFMDKDHAWIRVSAWVYPTVSPLEKKVWIVITFLHDSKCYNYFGSVKESEQMIPGQWNYMQIDYLTPNIRNPKDELQVYLWSLDMQTAYVDNMKVFLFTPKEKPSE